MTKMKILLDQFLFSGHVFLKIIYSHDQHENFSRPVFTFWVFCQLNLACFVCFVKEVTPILQSKICATCLMFINFQMLKKALNFCSFDLDQ